jgi:hypothetical protein
VVIKVITKCIYEYKKNKQKNKQTNRQRNASKKFEATLTAVLPVNYVPERSDSDKQAETGFGHTTFMLYNMI